MCVLCNITISLWPFFRSLTECQPCQVPPPPPPCAHSPRHDRQRCRCVAWGGGRGQGPGAGARGPSPSFNIHFSRGLSPHAGLQDMFCLDFFLLLFCLAVIAFPERSWARSVAGGRGGAPRPPPECQAIPAATDRALIPIESLQERKVTTPPRVGGAAACVWAARA